MSQHSHSNAGAHPELTRNQSLVLRALSQAASPLSAYSLLDLLRDQGFRAPLQVYRALDKLVAFGLVHRLESLNAFVACRHPDCDSEELVAFTICEACGDVAEISDDSLARRLKSLVKQADFELRTATVELRGHCEACRAG